MCKSIVPVYKKIVLVIVMIFCFSLIFSACSSKGPGSNTSAAVGVSTSAQKASLSKIVFNETIDDPQSEYMNTLGSTKAKGTAKLDLILFETKPNVFEGYGQMTRSLNMTDEALTSKQEYVYRTGLIHAEVGKGGSLTLTGGFTEDRNADTFMGEDAPFSFITHKDGTIMQKNLPFLLELKGEKALLTVKMHDHANFVFSGNLTTGSVEETPASDLPKADSLIYINSLWSGSLTDSIGDYTAILLATPAADKNGYSGQLSIDGNGSILKNINQKVTFSLAPFDSALYQKSGGKLIDRFSKMGILHTDGGDYILLLDEKQVVLEAAGKSMVFYGKLRSGSDLAFLKNEADKTKKMLSYLCRQKNSTLSNDYSELKGLDPNNPEDMKKLMEMSEKMRDTLNSEKGKPAWYPDGMIPTVNFSEDDSYLTTPATDEQFFKIYNTQYFESEDFTDLVKPYRAALSGYDDYQEHMDYDGGSGVFLFSMGKYNIQVYLQQSNLKLTSVSVQIY
ncbi:MAG: hypothetical protein Q8920_05375 [Bacillota bacterium]|nr:hypothetical protein [Bacillota bacterium]